MSLLSRLLCYLLAIALGGLGCMYWQYRQSLAAYEHDKSAMAVWGFLPLIFPIFFIAPAKIVAYVAMVVEAVLLVVRFASRH